MKRQSKTAREKEARAGRDYDRSEKHREAESRGMKKKPRKKSSAKSKEARAGHEYNESAKHKAAERRGMRGK